jgi:H+-transporting ATPase
LPTRLSAVDEAASIDVLCADKTGTLTRNQLTVTAVHPMPGFDEPHVLTMAALASSDGGQDPVDGAIRSAAAQKVTANAPKLILFVPFDPATKMSEATAADPSLGTLRIIKGAFAPSSAFSRPRHPPRPRRRTNWRRRAFECWRSQPDRRRRCNSWD